jgi:hypothetical protein
MAGARPSWTTELAYAIGIITTDGCLAQDGRHLSVSSKDVQLLETVRGCLGLRVAITPYRGGNGWTYHHLQWGSRLFHAWLVELGLMPAKSRRLAALAIPDDYFVDFLYATLRLPGVGEPAVPHLGAVDGSTPSWCHRVPRAQRQ